MLECSLPARNHQRGTSTWVPSPRPSTQTDGSLEATIHVTVWRRLGLERAAQRSVPTSRDGYRTLAPGPNPEIRNCHAFAKPWTIRPLASATNMLTVQDPGLPDEGKICKWRHLSFLLTQKTLRIEPLRFGKPPLISMGDIAKGIDYAAPWNFVSSQLNLLLGFSGKDSNRGWVEPERLLDNGA